MVQLAPLHKDNWLSLVPSVGRIDTNYGVLRTRTTHMLCAVGKCLAKLLMDAWFVV